MLDELSELPIRKHCKIGFNALDKQIYRCNDYGRQFVLNSAKGPISEEQKISLIVFC
ncbi:hypothetical protein CCP3SC5AM1_530017 [Gammaproteobacteria bacterium]